MSDAKIWLVIFGLALVTYAIRFSFLGLLGGRSLPPLVTRGLAFVPVTVLPALLLPMLLRGADGSWTADPARLIGAGVALAAGVAMRNVLAALVGGLIAFVAASQVF